MKKLNLNAGCKFLATACLLFCATSFGTLEKTICQSSFDSKVHAEERRNFEYEELLQIFLLPEVRELIRLLAVKNSTLHFFADYPKEKVRLLLNSIDYYATIEILDFRTQFVVDFLDWIQERGELTEFHHRVLAALYRANVLVQPVEWDTEILLNFSRVKNSGQFVPVQSSLTPWMGPYISDARISFEEITSPYFKFYSSKNRNSLNGQLTANKFVTTRSVEIVEAVLSFRNLSELFDFIAVTGIWYDLGAGIGDLQRSFLRRYGQQKFSGMVSVSLNQPTAEQLAMTDSSNLDEAKRVLIRLEADKVELAPKWTYLLGSPVENRTDLVTESGSLATNIFGSLDYTEDFATAINVPARILKPRGWLITTFGDRRVLTRSGTIYEWPEFIVKFGRGFQKPNFEQLALGSSRVAKAKSLDASGHLRILERTADPFTIPALKILAADWGKSPPRAIYFCAECP